GGLPPGGGWRRAGRRGRRRPRRTGGGPRRLRRRARRRHRPGPPRAPPVRRGGRNEEGREVPACPLRLVPGRRGRPGRALGGGASAGRAGPTAGAGGAEEGRAVTRLAAVDIGTNSIRLLVADSDGAGPAEPLATVERHMHITRLGQGVDASRRLHPDAVERTLAVLRKYREVMHSTGVEG